MISACSTDPTPKPRQTRAREPGVIELVAVGRYSTNSEMLYIRPTDVYHPRLEC